MNLFVCGLNHKTAQIEMREKFATSKQNTPLVLQHLKQHTEVAEALLLSTCNRTELYFCHEEAERVIHWLGDFHQVPVNEIKHALYVYHEVDAIKHLLRVSSGLDSLVPGEQQIFSQIKDAYRCALETGTMGKSLQKLFQMIFSATKQVRTKTGLSQHSLSIAYCAIQLAKHIFEKITQRKVLVVGAGDTIELVLRYLKSHDIHDITLASRTSVRAQQLVEQYQTHAIPLTQIPNILNDVDIVFSATSAPLPLFGKGMIERAMKHRHYRPLLLIDLAVPRDIEAEVADISDVFLYTIDDLQEIVEDNLKNRHIAVDEAEALIELYAQEFMHWQQSLSAIETIKNFRNTIKNAEQRELMLAQQALQRGESPYLVLQRFAHRFSNKVMHHPTLKLRQIEQAQQKQLLAAMQWLFDLPTSHN